MTTNGPSPDDVLGPAGALPTPDESRTELLAATKEAESKGESRLPPKVAAAMVERILNGEKVPDVPPEVAALVEELRILSAATTKADGAEKKCRWVLWEPGKPPTGQEMFDALFPS